MFLFSLFSQNLASMMSLKKINECFCSGLSLSVQLDCIHDRIKITSELMILQIFFLWRLLPVWLLHLRKKFQHWIKAKSKHMETVTAVFTPGQVQLLQAPFTYIYFHPFSHYSTLLYVQHCTHFVSLSCALFNDGKDYISYTSKNVSAHQQSFRLQSYHQHSIAKL